MKKIFTKTIIILILIILGGVGIYLILIKKNNQSRTNINFLNEPISNPLLEEDYEKNIKEILEAFANQKTQLNETIEKILKLTVPAKYKDLHLNLVIALTKIQQGREETNQAKIEEGLADLDKIRQKHNWLPEIIRGADLNQSFLPSLKKVTTNYEFFINR